MVTPAAFTVDHDSVDDSPPLMVGGSTVKERIAGVGGAVDERLAVKLRVTSPYAPPGRRCRCRSTAPV
jgi:hypothetical protein